MSFIFIFFHFTFLMNLRVRSKKSLDFFEIFSIPLKAASINLRRFPDHFSEFSKFVHTEQHWKYTSILKICSCGLGKLWVNNSYHLPKFQFFGNFHPSISISTTAFVIQAGKLFLFIDMFTRLFSTSVLYNFLPCFNKYILNMILNIYIFNRTNSQLLKKYVGTP